MTAPLPVIITPNAADDLAASWVWLRDRNPPAADEWLTGIRETILALGAMPDARQYCDAEGNLKADTQDDRATMIDRVSNMVGLAAETFNDGLRAYYLSFAAGSWFFSPAAFAIGTAVVIYILFRREFQSDVVEVLSD